MKAMTKKVPQGKTAPKITNTKPAVKSNIPIAAKPGKPTPQNKGPGKVLPRLGGVNV